VSINEEDLPGIGRRYEISAVGGMRVLLVVHHSGRRDLYVLHGSDEEPLCSVELTDDQARRIGAILSGAYFKPAVVEQIEEVIGEFVVDWVTVAADSPVVGRSIRDLQVRRRTGMTIISIVRGAGSINSPDPDERLRAEDRLVVVGPRRHLAGFVDFVTG
jgi:TrkA domain protein